LDKLSEKGERKQTEDKKRERKKKEKAIKNIILFFAPFVRSIKRRQKQSEQSQSRRN
jgi:RNA polymerase-interacting CarD/CdnL/TRCF family regulator